MVYSDRTLSYKARNPGSTTTDRQVDSFSFFFFSCYSFLLREGGGAKGENNLVKNINYKKAFFKKIASQLYFE